jgi:hypothetical protein
MQIVQALLCLFLKRLNLAEPDRLRGASFRTSWLQPDLLAVVTKRAFESAPIILVSLDHSEGTRRNAVSAAVAHIRLNEDPAELRPYY